VKIKYGILALFALGGIAELFLAGCKTPSPAEIEGTRTIKGTDFKLVAKYRPLHLYIYADTASTNPYQDYVIFQGNEPMILAENKSNTVEIVFDEKNFRGQLTTTYDHEGRILKRAFSQSFDLRQTSYFYFDTNADGLWDKFIIHGTNVGSMKAYTRSNLCWVPIQPE
jgi:hypothetical protein